MLQVAMTAPSGVALDTSGKYCGDNVQVTPVFPFADNAKKWVVTLQSDTVASQPCTLLTDPWIAEHYADSNLVVAVIAQDPPAPASGKRYVGTLINANLPSNKSAGGTRLCYGCLMVCSGSSDAMNLAASDYPLYVDTITGYAKLSADSQGNIKVIVDEWRQLAAGSYAVMAWLV